MTYQQIRLAVYVLVAVFVYGFLTLAAAPKAHADPDQCDARYQTCLGSLVYCPDTGQFITRFSGSCPSLWVGPYLPGGLQPNQPGPYEGYE